MKERDIIKWWQSWKPVPPPKIDDRRTIYGIDAYQRALVELALEMVGKRYFDPPEELKKSLPKTYKETAFLFKSKNGDLWEYTTIPPHSHPLLKELTAEEARTLFGYETE